MTHQPDDGSAGWVFNIQRFSVHDGPGIRTTIFMKGCPLRCLWCDNPESQQAQPQIVMWHERCIRCGACLLVCQFSAIAEDANGRRLLLAERCDLCGACANACYAGAIEQIGRLLSVDEAVDLVEQDAPFYNSSGGGVTLSGGEPLAQPAFSARLLAACRSRGLHTAMETSGHAPWDAWERLLPHLDLVLYDLKEVDPDRHRSLTAVPNGLILANFRRLLAAGVPIIVRRPVIPGCNDSSASIHALGRLLADTGVDRVDLLPYHRFGRGKYERLGRAYTMGDRPSLAEQDVVSQKEILASYGLMVTLGG